jgi:acetyl esterase/lipase
VAERLAAATPRPRFAGSLTWLLACLILLVTTASADAAVQRGIVYGHGQVAGGMAPLRLDLYRPAVSPAPVVVLIHGGGFARGSRSDPSIARIGRALAAQGIAAACIDYRLAGSAPRPSARVAPLLAGLPRTPVRRAVAAAVDDTLTAIGFLRRNSARFGLDPRRIGLVGGSAGAMTATHVAYVLDDYGIARPPIRFVGDLWGGVIVDPPGGAQLSAFPLAARRPAAVRRPRHRGPRRARPLLRPARRPRARDRRPGRIPPHPGPRARVQRLRLLHGAPRRRPDAV